MLVGGDGHDHGPNIAAMFRHYDHEGSGELSKRELKEILTDQFHLEGITEEYAHAMALRFDRNGDGAIDETDFAALYHYLEAQEAQEAQEAPLPGPQYWPPSSPPAGPPPPGPPGGPPPPAAGYSGARIPGTPLLPASHSGPRIPGWRERLEQQHGWDGSSRTGSRAGSIAGAGGRVRPAADPAAPGGLSDALADSARSRAFGTPPSSRRPRSRRGSRRGSGSRATPRGDHSGGRGAEGGARSSRSNRSGSRSPRRRSRRGSSGSAARSTHSVDLSDGGNGDTPKARPAVLDDWDEHSEAGSQPPSPPGSVTSAALTPLELATVGLGGPTQSVPALGPGVSPRRAAIERRRCAAHASNRDAHSRCPPSYKLPLFCGFGHSGLRGSMSSNAAGAPATTRPATWPGRCSTTEPSTPAAARSRSRRGRARTCRTVSSSRRRRHAALPRRPRHRVSPASHRTVECARARARRLISQASSGSRLRQLASVGRGAARPGRRWMSVSALGRCLRPFSLPICAIRC